eukprot:gene16766-23041_t
MADYRNGSGGGGRGGDHYPLNAHYQGTPSHHQGSGEMQHQYDGDPSTYADASGVGYVAGAQTYSGQQHYPASATHYQQPSHYSQHRYPHSQGHQSHQPYHRQHQRQQHQPQHHSQEQQGQQYEAAPSNSYVGWGGQAINDNQSFRVPWFGRNRPKGVMPSRGGNKGHEGGRTRGTWDSNYVAPAPAASAYSQPSDAMSVDEVVHLVRSLPKWEGLPDQVYRALYHLDSRAVSTLLKELSRRVSDKRAVELFSYLQDLSEHHVLRPLCDVYTYTTMISLCNYTHNVDRAMQLVDEMRRQSIDRNVHTYTALMNVCIKCGRYQLAVEVFESMRAVKQVPNVVTYNTLIDVYGKLGLWEKALQVIDTMKRELGQVDNALEVYQEMIRQNMERSVITYSSLISACEKGDQWETALNIFGEMRQEGCAPNTVTFNSLITACAQGGQCEKAREVFDQMAAASCAPDVVTYTALITAYERGGDWQQALHVFHQMCLQGCRPDAIVFNAIIDALWGTGVVWAQ